MTPLSDPALTAHQLALLQREHSLAAQKSVLRATQGLSHTLEANVAMLRMANERLLISSIEAQIMTDEIRRARDLMGHMAHYDFLTDLPNCSLLMERLAQAITHARRQGTQLPFHRC
jgi:PleD family two-component response regulator